MRRIFFSFFLFIMACSKSEDKETPPEPVEDPSFIVDDRPPKTIAGYKLVWNDEFDYTGGPDVKKWAFEAGFARNRELQWYQSDNAVCKRGRLIIEGRRESKTNPFYNPTAPAADWQYSRPTADYTSSSLITYGKQAWKYGRFEIRARLPFEWGSWPAIWFKGTSDRSIGWPRCGEIDLLEMYPTKFSGEMKQTILANVMDGTEDWHSTYNPVGGFEAKDPEWKRKYHVWRMDWDEESIILYLDDVQLNSVKISDLKKDSEGYEPFKNEMYLLINLAIGSSGGDPVNSKFPIQYEVDYVRVYQKIN